jgi:hypothetical protein
VQLSDPWWMWKMLRDLAPSNRTPPTVSTATGTTTSAIYGALGSFEPSPATNSSQTVFSIPFSYIRGTTQVYRGLPGQLALQSPGVDYTESSPGDGEITFTSAPSTAQDLWIVCRLAGGLT